jgi:hypothetical protein
MQAPGAGESLELDVAGRAEVDLARVGQLLHQGGDEDLASCGLAGDAGRQSHVLAEEVVALFQDLAGVDTDTDGDRLLGLLLGVFRRPVPQEGQALLVKRPVP